MPGPKSWEYPCHIGVAECMYKYFPCKSRLRRQAFLQTLCPFSPLIPSPSWLLARAEPAKDCMPGALKLIFQSLAHFLILPRSLAFYTSSLFLHEAPLNCLGAMLICLHQNPSNWQESTSHSEVYKINLSISRVLTEAPLERIFLHRKVLCNRV